MGRSILGVVAGYVVMSILVIVTLTGAYLALGAERAFQPASFEVTGFWIIISTVLSFVAAMAGGLIAAMLGKGTRAPMFLAVVVVVLGVILAIPTLDAPEPGGPRTGEIRNFDAMMSAEQPSFVAFLNPVIGAVGVLVGGRMRRPGRAS